MPTPPNIPFSLGQIEETPSICAYCSLIFRGRLYHFSPLGHKIASLLLNLFTVTPGMACQPSISLKLVTNTPHRACHTIPEFRLSAVGPNLEPCTSSYFHHVAPLFTLPNSVNATMAWQFCVLRRECAKYGCRQQYPTKRRGFCVPQRRVSSSLSKISRANNVLQRDPSLCN